MYLLKYLVLSLIGAFIYCNYLFRVIKAIVNGGEWLWSPANIKGASKDAKIYVGRSTTVHNLLFCVIHYA